MDFVFLEQPATPASIRDGWTRADTAALHEASRRLPGSSTSPANHVATRQWQDQYQQQMDRLRLVIGRHVLHLAASTGLSVAPHSGHVDIPSINAWRAAADGSLSNRQAICIGYMLERNIAVRFMSADCQDPATRQQDPLIEKIHGFILDAISAGNFDMHETEVGGACMTSGLHLSLTIKDWVPSLHRFDHEKRQFFPLAATDITPPTLQHATIPVPSGQLLVADWFRHQAFIDITEQALAGSPSINSAAGCQERTSRMASLGVANVYVGNTCPSIIASDDGVRIGTLALAEENCALPYVCTDLWWATIVDRQVLVDLFARTMSTEQAINEVEDLVSGNDTIAQVSVPPGEYHLYYAGDFEMFGKLIDPVQSGTQDLEEPMLVLSRNPIEPRPARATPKA